MLSPSKSLEVSFVIPAHNEEQALPATLLRLQQSARVLACSYEIIVVADSCTDRTAPMASSHGARVLEVAHRQIAATRNSGATAAFGKILVFVDADTQVHEAALTGALTALEKGAVGGGALVTMDDPVPWWFRSLEHVWNTWARITRTAGGCFLFCPKSVFLKSGGFPEDLYAAEELVFAARLKQMGRFVVLKEKIVSSGRKARTHSGRELLHIAWQMLRRGKAALKDRDSLAYFYTRRIDPKMG